MDSSNFHHVLLAVNQFFIALIMHYFAAAPMKGMLGIGEGGGASILAVTTHTVQMHESRSKNFFKDTFMSM